MTAPPHDKHRPDSRPERAPTPPKPFSPKTWPIKVTSIWTTNSLPARPDPGPALTTLTLTPEQDRWLHDHLAGLLADLDPTDDPQIEWARALTDQLSAQLP